MAEVVQKVKFAVENEETDSPKVKKMKTDSKTISLPTSTIVKFFNQDKETTGNPIDVPLDITIKQLETLINSLLGNENPVPYAFYIKDIEVIHSLKETLEQLRETEGKDFSLEETLAITYQPLSVFRVRPVTRCAETMPGHTDAVIHVSYSPDGKRLASGGGDLMVRFWNIITSMPEHICSGHRHHVLCTAWSPNGKYFVSGDKSGELRIWDPSTGQQKGIPLTGHKKWITSIAFEPFHMDPNCTRFATSSKDQTIRIWNLSNNTCETTVSGHTDSVECVKWGGSGLLYSCSRDRTIKVWAIDGHGRSQQKLVRTLSGHAHRINSLALNCDYVCRTGFYELSNNKSSSAVASSSSVATMTLEEQQEIARQRYRTLVGSEGERLVSGSDDFTLFMWKPEEDKAPLTRMTGHQQLVNQIAFSPDGRYVASASFDKKIKIWCGKTGRFLASLNGHVGAVYQVSWSADSLYIASASKDSTVKVWYTKDPKKAIYTLSGHEDEVYTLDWSPDGTQLASGSKDRTIKIWRN
jgi:ribosome assembly protein 4